MWIVLFFAFSALWGEPCDDPMIEQCNHYNDQVKESRKELAQLTKKATEAHHEGDEKALRISLQQYKALKDRVSKQQKEYQSKIRALWQEGKSTYDVWDRESMSLGDFLLEYGSSDYLYFYPPEIGSVRIVLRSGLPLPKESWTEMVQMILSHNGIGIKQTHPWIRELYFVKNDLTVPQVITNKAEDVEMCSEGERILYVLSPRPEFAKACFSVMDKFRNAKTTFLYQVGEKLVFIGSKTQVKHMIQLYHNMWGEKEQKTSKVVMLSKITPLEGVKVLKAYFGGLKEQQTFSTKNDSVDLSAIPMSKESSLVLVGSKENVKRASELLVASQEQMNDPEKKSLFLYHCKNSDPKDLAVTLEQVYSCLVSSCTDMDDGQKNSDLDESYLNHPPYHYGPPGPPYQPPPQKEDSKTRETQFSHFIPYPKTGALVVVVRKDLLEKIKQILRQIDIPKKMVEIEVLLCEKRLFNKNDAGLNILKLGTDAATANKTGVSYDIPLNKGVFEFFFSRPKSTHFPAVDIQYNFLISQSDIRVNASPSVKTVNQMPAKISIVEEISINDGSAPVNSNAGIIFKESFTRNEYGTVIEITPTIHEPSFADDKEQLFVTLDTNITFDTIQSLGTSDYKPDVQKRQIKNQVRVIDGETVILGGLRRKQAEDRTEKIPLLGEIPGLAKLFGTSKLSDQMTEMFIFITPRVIPDPIEERKRHERERLQKRPGDLPEFYRELRLSKNKHKSAIFAQTWRALFGKNTIEI